MDRKDLLDLATARARAANLEYAGQVTPAEAHQLFEEGLATIVDVRTRPEWEFVGHVEGAPLVEWRAYGARDPDPRFVEKLAARFAKDEPLLLLCRSGVRSREAAVAAARGGFTRVFNVLEGFEGDLDADGRRGNLGGWRRAGLPWAQG